MPEGFWKTWGHILTGLVLLALVASIPTGAYLVGYRNGRDKGQAECCPDGCPKPKCCPRRMCNIVSVEDRDPKTGKFPALGVPFECRIKNCAARDGGGLNVVACVETAARYQNIKSLSGLLDQQQAKAGGCYPEKLIRILEPTGVAYRQGEYKEASTAAAVVEEAIREGKVPCVTDHGPGRYRCRVNTMACVLHLDPEDCPQARACLLDPNWHREVEWISREEFLKRCKPGSEGKAWVVVLDGEKPKDALEGWALIMPRAGEGVCVFRAGPPPGLWERAERAALSHNPRK